MMQAALFIYFGASFLPFKKKKNNAQTDFFKADYTLCTLTIHFFNLNPQARI